MDAFFHGLRELFVHPWSIAATIVVLVAYRYAASKGRMPKIPVGMLILYLIVVLILMTFPDSIASLEHRWVRVGLSITLYCAIAHLILAFIYDVYYGWWKKTRVPKITRDITLFAVFAVVALYVLRTRGGVNPLGIVTTSAVLTAIVGLAAQNSLSNLFAGLSIQMERPYAIGEWIQYNDTIGRVIGVGWKSTRVRTFDDEIVYIPNLDIVKTTVTNFSKPTPMHYMNVSIGVEYGAAPNHVRKVLLEVCRHDPRVLAHPVPEVRLVDYGDFAITYDVRFAYNGYGQSPRLRSDIQYRFWYALNRVGIRIPFPIRDVHHRHIERRIEEEKSKQVRLEARGEIDRVPIVEPLSVAERDLLGARMQIQTFGDNETIVAQGDAGDSLHILHDGACDIFVRNERGGQAKVSQLTPPAFFGEMSLLTGEPRSATVRAVGDTTVFTIDKELFGEILTANPTVSDALAQALAKRSDDTRESVGRSNEDERRRASQLKARIKKFFGMG